MITQNNDDISSDSQNNNLAKVTSTMITLAITTQNDDDVNNDNQRNDENLGFLF